MPQWIYTRPPEKCQATELKVAAILNKLPDTWIVRWGFFYKDDKNVTREGDFLVFGPDGGLLVLEAKTILKCFNGTGEWTSDSDNPKIQLDAEWKGVLNELKNSCSLDQIPFVAKALAVPSESISDTIRFYQGIPRDELLDQRDLAHFTGSWHQIFNGQIKVPAALARASFLKTYGAELQNIRHFIKETDALLLRQLTLDYELLDALADNHQLLVTGGVGSGKTWMALEQARRLASESADGNSVLFLCYNLNLAHLLKDWIAKHPASKGSIQVMAWEELIQDLMQSANLQWEPPDKNATTQTREYFYNEVLPFEMNHLLETGKIIPRFDALIVDEAQDHDTEFPASAQAKHSGGWWTFYRALLRNGANAPIGIYFDPAQRPAFRTATFSTETLSAWAPGAAKIRLLKTLRYTRQILKFLQELKSESTTALVNGLNGGIPLHEGPKVEIYSASPGNTVNQVQKIIETWETQGYCKPSEILILSKKGTPLESGEFQGIRHLGKWRIAPTGYEADLAISSFNKAKGLDSLAVIMIDTPPFNQLSEVDKTGYWMAASRARQLLAVVHLN